MFFLFLFERRTAGGGRRETRVKFFNYENLVLHSTIAYNINEVQ